MEAAWKWDRLNPLEQQVADLLAQGKSNAAICAEVFLSRARVQESIKRILIKTGMDSTRAAIALLVEEREGQTLLHFLDQATDGVVILQDRVVVFANRALHQIQEYEPYEMNGIPFVELLAPRSRGMQIDHYDLRMRGKPFVQSYVVSVLCKSGHEKDLNVASGGLIRYRGKPALLAFGVPAAQRQSGAMGFSNTEG